MIFSNALLLFSIMNLVALFRIIIVFYTSLITFNIKFLLLLYYLEIYPMGL